MRNTGSSQRYIYGSSAEEEIVRVHPERKKQPRVRRARKKKTNRLFTAAAAAIIVVTLAVPCARFVEVRTSVMAYSRKIKSDELELASLREKNDTLAHRINSSQDLDRVYQVATGEFGMTYPQAGQILEYDREENEYVRQYDDIPEK